MYLKIGKESLELGSAVAESIIDDIVSDVADDREAFYLEVAKHGTSKMRSTLANLSPMPESIFNALVENADSEMFYLLISNKDAAVYVTQEMVDNLINSDDYISLQDFIGCEQNLRHLEGIDEKLEQLAQHPDPLIRCAVARNLEISEHILAQLLHDSDADVEHIALKNLRIREGKD